MLKKDYTKSLFGRIPFTKYKFWEMEFSLERDYYTYFNFNINITRKTDHNGIYFNFDLFYFNSSIRIYDSRHWDYEKDQYESY